MRNSILAVLISMLVCGGASAQLELDPRPEDRNAAVKYGVFWAVNAPHAPTRDLYVFSPDRFEFGTLSLSISEWLYKDSTARNLDELCEIAAMPYCNFEHPLERGSVPAPHLGSLYGWSVKALFIDGAFQVDRGERAKAVERYVAILGVASHAAGEKLGVTANVSMKFTGYALTAIEEMIEGEPLGVGSAERILEALDRLDADDPFGVIAMLETSPQLARHNALDLLGATLEVAGGMVEISGLDPDSLPRQPSTDEERALIEQEMVGVENATAGMIDAYRANDLQAVREIGRAISQGEYGDLAKIAMSNLSRVRMNQTRIQERMDALRSELHKIVDGD